ncbi:MAG: PhoU domain-containing protein [bacterium]|nr:PhoU domain-containing protein [bacterium]
MTIPATIVDNLRFILLEVTRQVEETQKALDRGGEEELIAKIIARDDYIDSLKTYVENKCFSLIYSNSSVKMKSEADLIRAINTITGNLERIADHSVNIARQLPYFDDRDFIKAYDYKHFFDIIIFNLKRIHKALFDHDLSLARKICVSESKLDRAYKRSFEKVLKELTKGKEVENLLTTIFILRYLERIGDCLLNIGEAIIFSIVGDKLKLKQFEFLEESLLNVDELTIEDIKFEGVWGTRSGCRIGLITTATSEGDERDYVFKEGSLPKIEKEKEKIELWNHHKPGVTPKVLDFKIKGDHASLLVEYLDGDTMQHNLLESNDQKLFGSLTALEETLAVIWRNTRDDEKKPSCDSLNQLENRIDEVFRVHPSYSLPEVEIGGLKIDSFKSRIDRLRDATKGTVAPFAVLIHGDFNLDNIFYDEPQDQIRFIDVHRSGFGDYAQDVAVFLASNFRQKVFEEGLRLRIEQAARHFLDFARRFAQEQNDLGFEKRLGLGLIRALTTSTRFEFHPELSEALFQRSLYLIDQMLAPDAEQNFRVPDSLFSL